MKIGFARGGSFPRIDGYQLWRVRTAAAIEYAHPQHGVGFGDVVPDVQDAIRFVDIVVGARLPVAAECFLEGRSRGGGTEPCIAIHMRRANSRLPNDCKRVILLKHQLSRGVEPDSRAGVALNDVS